MQRFQTIAVLMGGVSAERDVSLRSGRAVATALRQAGYSVHEVDVTTRALEIPAGVQAVFIALHGAYGEDGEVQAELRRRGLPFTGPGEAASRVAIDKEATKRLAVQHGIPTAAFEILRRGDSRTLALPVVVKPACEGSSIGVHRVLEASEWEAAIEDTWRHEARAVVERYVAGRELTVGVLDELILPAVEIVAPGGWYDYGAKYTPGACRYLVPAPLDAGVADAARHWARRTFDVLGCRGVSRVDFRLDDSGALFLLEVNTIPGFTETSLLPKAAAQSGLAFGALCERLLSRASCEP